MLFSRRTCSVTSDIFLVWLHKQQRGRKRSQTTKAPLACFTTHNSNITIEVLYKLIAMANRHCHLCDLREIKPETGVPNNSFLLNTLTTTFKAIQSTFRSLEMHSKQRYKICICSDIVLGELWKFQRLQYYFPRKFQLQFNVLWNWEFF